MKKILKFIISIAALIAGIVGVLAGIKILLDKFAKKEKEPIEKFSFDGDELESLDAEEFLSETQEAEEAQE